MAIFHFVHRVARWRYSRLRRTIKIAGQDQEADPDKIRRYENISSHYFRLRADCSGSVGGNWKLPRNLII